MDPKRQNYQGGDLYPHKRNNSTKITPSHDILASYARSQSSGRRRHTNHPATPHRNQQQIPHAYRRRRTYGATLLTPPHPTPSTRAHTHTHSRRHAVTPPSPPPHTINTRSHTEALGKGQKEKLKPQPKTKGFHTNTQTNML